MKVTAIAPWFGSKRTLAPLIVDQLGPHKAYLEPFCGSMSVLLRKSVCSFEVVNDLHGDLTNLAWVIQHHRYGPQLYRRLRRTLFNEETFEQAKLCLEDEPIASSMSDLDKMRGHAHELRAYYYFIFCWMGRSGIIGTKRSNNTFTVRYTANGGNQATRFTSAVDSIPTWRRRLRSTTILRRNGFELLERIADDPGTSIYVDPPYLVKNGKYEHDFTDADHARLASLLLRFHNARIVVSYYDHPRLAELYPEWTRMDCTRTKHLAVQGRRGSTSVSAPELLLLNGPVFGAANDSLFVQ